MGWSIDDTTEREMSEREAWAADIEPNSAPPTDAPPANVHHVRELMDEVFGSDNFFGDLVFFKAGSLEEGSLPRRNDYILWYCRDLTRTKFRRLYKPKDFYEETEQYNLVQESGGVVRRISDDERRGVPLPDGARIFRYVVLTKPGPGQRHDVELEGKTYSPGIRWWGFPPESMQKLITSGRIAVQGNSLASMRCLDDFPVSAIDNVWTDTATGSGMQKLYVVQTASKVIERCTLMTTEPGGEQRQVAVKVIDDGGNEWLVVEKLD